MDIIDNDASTPIGLNDGHPSSLTQAHGAVVQRRVEDLRPHPSFAKYNLGRSVPEISILCDRGEAAYLQPITITQDGSILDGYSIWHLAKMQKRDTLLCLVRQMSHQEALLHLIQKSRLSNGLNDFLRILLALELEPWFKTRAKANQRIGGQQKGSSNLTEGYRLDVRSKIARAANVSTGNVTKG